MKHLGSCMLCLALGFYASACSSGDGSAPSPGSDDAAQEAGGRDASRVDSSSPEAGTKHSISARIALTKDPDGQHVSFATQNGSKVTLAVTDIVGKSVYWATTPGGEAIGNVTMPIDRAISAMASDLTSTFATAAHYADGPYEVYCVISLTGSMTVPSPGDLAAFKNSPPAKGDPPDTGESVRVDVKGEDATLTLGNQEFIRFGSAP